MAGNIPYRNLIFIPVFFSFYILFKAIGTPDLLLNSFGGRPVSMATAEGIDVGARVALFYKGLLFLIFLLLALTRLTLLVQRFIPREEIQLMNGLSLAAFCLLFFRLIGAEIGPSLHVIFGLLAMVAIGSLFHQVRKREGVNYNISLLWSAMMGTAVFFLQWQLSRFLKTSFLSLPMTLMIFGSAFYLLSTNKFRIDYRVLRSSFPFILLPLLSFGSMENSMIFNQHNIFISPAVFYFIGFIALVTYSFYAFKKYKGIHSGISHEIRLFRTWMPWLLAGIFCMAFYSPIVHADVDIFESANNILPLQQWFNFGRVPLLDTFNAHAIADFGPGWLYSIFNGHDPMGYFVYRFLVHVVVLISVYILIYKISGDGYLALWLTLAYPYIDQLIPSYFNLVPIPVIAFIRLYEKQTTGRYLFYFLSIVLMIFWRVDLGFAVLVAGTLSLLFLLFYVPVFEINKSALKRSLLYSILIVAVIFFIAWIKAGSHIFVSIRDVLGYLSSVQSYGRIELSSQINLEYYSLYFILPSVILLILAVTIYNVRTAHFSGNNVLAALAIIFLAVFFFANFQRGLIRHTLYENWSNALTSYGFFIVAAYILLIIHKHHTESRFLIFFIVSTLLVANYFYQQPDLKTNNTYFIFSDNMYKSSFGFFGKQKVNRVIEDASISAGQTEFKNWLDKNYPKSTFIDFSNTPMMYYYTNREIPGYFVQPPQASHNEYLQKRFIDDLKEYDVPVAVLANVPANFWDYLDGIPNTMRHYRICEYLYREYKPAYIMSGHSVWIKKNIDIPVEKELYSYDGTNFITGAKCENGTYTVITDRTYFDYKLAPLFGYNGKIYARINFYSKYAGEMKFYYKTNLRFYDEQNKRSLQYYSGQNDLFVMIGNLNTDEQITDFKLELNYGSEVKFSSIKFFGAENVYDHISESPINYSLKWIPYVWGQYDENYKSGKINQLEKIIDTQRSLQKDNTILVNFNPVKNRENGNYLKVTMKNSSTVSPVVIVGYGEALKTYGGFTFNLKNDSTYHDYLIRISSQYNWYANLSNWITLTTSENSEINKAEILEGE